MAVGSVMSNSSALFFDRFLQFSSVPAGHITLYIIVHLLLTVFYEDAENFTQPLIWQIVPSAVCYNTFITWRWSTILVAFFILEGVE